MKLRARDGRLLRALPVALVKVKNGVAVIRGCCEFVVQGEIACTLLQAILKYARLEARFHHDLLELAVNSISSEGVSSLDIRNEAEAIVTELMARHILVEMTNAVQDPAIESILDIFYWHFSADAKEVSATMNTKHVSILGVNSISAQLARTLTEAEFSNFSIVDFNAFRNLRWYGNGDLAPIGPEWPANFPIVSFDKWKSDHQEATSSVRPHLLVATSEFGAFEGFRLWNEYCVSNGVAFFPIMLDRLVGSVGPLVIPHETACYECLRLRESANDDQVEIANMLATLGEHRQLISGFHPAMTHILGSIAAMEITRFMCGVMPPQPGRLIDVKLLGSNVQPRRVLKLPRCPVCSPTITRSSFFLDKEGFIPGTLE